MPSFLTLAMLPAVPDCQVHAEKAVDQQHYPENRILHIQHVACARRNFLDNVAGQLPFQYALGNQVLLAALQVSESLALVLLLELVLVNSLR